jgi:hypothetical protein
MYLQNKKCNEILNSFIVLQNITTVKHFSTDNELRTFTN